MTKSEELFKKAQNIMPGGVNSPVRAFNAVKKTPFFVEKAQGAYIYDADGNKYIDYVCSWGPGILGHAYPKVIEAVKKVCDNGLTFGAPTEKELILAELIQKCVPSMEMIRLVSSGTEAVMSAVRVARGFTGRDKIIKFIGCYHGHSDGLLMKAGSGVLTEAIPDSAGIPKDYAKYTLLADYNDENSVRKLMEQYGDDVACIVVEPVAANMGVVPPKSGFLKFLREITKQYGALLIFDEVITGFRLALGGAQEYYGVTPDLSTFGKIVGGGMPLAVYGGRKDVMSCVAPVGAIYSEIDRKASILEKAYKQIGLQTKRVGSLLSVFFTDTEISNYKDVSTCDVNKFADYFNHMLNNGIYVAPSQFESMFVSFAHTDEIIKQTANVILQYNF